MFINYKKRGLFKTIASLIRVKLIFPMLRSKKPPENTARGAMVGMVWAMTPLIGIQMYMSFLTWLFTKRFFKWEFNLPVALAWTWVTNVVTAPPFYYVFYLTGKFFMGSYEGHTSYNSFYVRIKEILCQDDVLTAIKMSLDLFIKDMGFAMFLGAIPWAIIGGWGAYKWTLLYLNRRAKTLAQRLENRQKRLEKKLENTQRKLEVKIEKLEVKLEKTIEAKEVAFIEKEEAEKEVAEKEEAENDGS